jgi:hypothetical protein
VNIQSEPIIVTMQPAITTRNAIGSPPVASAMPTPAKHVMIATLRKICVRASSSSFIASTGEVAVE